MMNSIILKKLLDKKKETLSYRVPFKNKLIQFYRTAISKVTSISVLPPAPLAVPSFGFAGSCFNTMVSVPNPSPPVVTVVSSPIGLLFASTSAAWEMASPYAKSKVAAEDVIKEKAGGYTIFRFFNVSGSDGVHKQIGPSTHLIRVAAEVACKKRDWIDIYGTDYNTKDGTCIRDYVHVVDLANAICNAVDDGPSNTPYECLGSNEGYSVFDVVATMRKVTGKPIAEKICGRREGDAEASVVDTLSEKITLTKSLEDMCIDQYNLERGKNK